MMIPKNIEDEHFQQAATYINQHGVVHGRESDYYHLILNGRYYPPKYMISLAVRFLTGTELPASSFDAGDAINYFKSRDYLIVDSREGADEDLLGKDDRSEYPEGRGKFILHRLLERSSRLRKEAKAKRLIDTGRLDCEVCGFNFLNFYGMGGDFIEAHHIVPISESEKGRKTKISELALVCSNCHRMLHRGEKLLSIADLKELIEKQKSGN